MMENNESKEMYLETMYNLYSNNEKIRITDIAQKLELTKASVSRAINLLVEDKLIFKEHYGEIMFSDKGLEYAKFIKQKHDLITEFLFKTLNISKETAEVDACRIEHFISDETAEAIKRYIKNEQD